MRTFYIISHTEDDSAMRVVDYEAEGHEFIELWKGVPIDKEVLSRMRLFVDDGANVDYLANPCSLFIASNRLLELLQKVAAHNFEYFDAPIRDLDGRESVKEYKLVNIIRVVDALAEPLVTLQTMKIDSKKMPDDAHLFRIRGHESVKFCSGEVLSEMRGKGLTGIALLPVSTV
jgi:hypothetical protein